MSVQRFCPLCDRSFQESEAVLRCDGCGVLHHPGCWVTNGGCGTQTKHQASPSALAYSNRAPIGGAQAPHPGEGTRVTTAPPVVGGPVPEPIPFRPNRAQAPETEADEEEPVIGATAPPQMVHRTLPSTVGTPSSAPRRYQPPPGGDHMPRKTMPQIYDRPRILAYWYVPAAALVAIVVALSVIWLVGQFTGDDPEQAADPTPAPTTSGGGITTAQPTTGTTTAVPSTASPGPSTGAGKFKGNDAVLVSGTAPDCLNVRVKAGRENDAIVCVKDGTELVVTGGPETANELTWWKVRTDLGEGWAAEEYLTKKP